MDGEFGDRSSENGGHRRSEPAGMFLPANACPLPESTFATPADQMLGMHRRIEATLAELRTKERYLSTRQTESRPRERLIDAAYELFSRDGVNQVGIDTILAKSGCAKASLYSNFKTKVELAVAFLDRREAVWTRAWLENEIKRRATSPEARLLAIFDVFDGWFHKKSFEGCSFINVLLESRAASPVRRAAAIHLAKIRAIVRGLAEEANLREPDKFAQAWHMLMKGAIVSAGEGNRNAARHAKCAARLVLKGWKRSRQARKPAARRSSDR